MVNANFIEFVATVCFALAVLHTFSVKFFQAKAQHYSDGSVGENLFHLLGEVEVVFGLWAGLFILIFMSFAGIKDCISYLESRDFTEPIFVFVIMTICASRPVLALSEKLIQFASKALPLNRVLGFYVAALVVGPILGSFITEPAAMTVTALILLKNFYGKNISEKLKYATLGLLFVNISIGGTLTPFAAPPILMVASKWNWDLAFMLSHFGWKAFLAILVSTSIIAYTFRKEISGLDFVHDANADFRTIPYWVIGAHLLILGAVILSSHFIIVFTGLFLFFLGLASVTKEYQNELKIKEALLVGFFLGGLVVLGGYQRWWLEPILTQLTTLPLYLGAISLTAITDNAAITYLGGQVPRFKKCAKCESRS